MRIQEPWERVRDEKATSTLLQSDSGEQVGEVVVVSTKSHACQAMPLRTSENAIVGMRRQESWQAGSLDFLAGDRARACAGRPQRGYANIHFRGSRRMLPTPPQLVGYFLRDALGLWRSGVCWSCGQRVRVVDYIRP
jgi:hypothetical protein